MREACRQMQVWQTQFPSNLPLTISVNISSKQFSQPDLINQIHQVLQETGLNPHFLKLEITESLVAENTESVTPTLTQLQALGLQISMDNFGTTYSSLNYLYRLPINTLKIDGSFIRNLNIEVEKVELIRTIVALAWNLGINVVAEGVETKKQMYQLQMLKCDYGQGYLFSEPLDSVDSEMAQELIAEGFPLRQLLPKATSSADV